MVVLLLESSIFHGIERRELSRAADQSALGIHRLRAESGQGAVDAGFRRPTRSGRVPFFAQTFLLCARYTDTMRIWARNSIPIRTPPTLLSTGFLLSRGKAS